MDNTRQLAMHETPGVYIEEPQLFPLGVPQVETAVPAFIGYTQKAEKDGQTVSGKAVAIQSMVEFQQYFGGEPEREVTVELSPANTIRSVTMRSVGYLYDSLMLSFANGGGRCYVVSVGPYASPVSPSDFTNALDELKTLDEPTLVVMPDAMLIDNPAQVSSVQQKALDHCQTLRDRFAILDVKIADLNKTAPAELDITRFRSGISNSLPYGAAYYPWLKTALPFEVSFTNLTIKKNGELVTLDHLLPPVAKTAAGATVDALQNDLDTLLTIFPIKAKYLLDSAPAKKKGIDEALKTFTDFPATGFKAEAVRIDFETYVKANSPELTEVLQKIDGLETGSDLADYQNAFEAVVTFITNFQTVTESHLVEAQERLPADESTARLVADAVSLKTDSNRYATAGSPDSVLPGRSAYFNIPDNENRRIFMEAALNKFSSLTPATAFSSLETRLSFSKYLNPNSANGHTYYDLLNAIQIITPDRPKSEFNTLFEEVTGYIHRFWTDLANRLKTKALEIRGKVPVFNTIVSAAEAQRIVLPPSGAVAGMYARVDANRGVWKAPANEALSNVVGPTVLLTDADQAVLNVDDNAGKSINAIRLFPGKGTLVWGARTLAGNDNEWRYVSVRRFFIMVEESVKKATAPFLFEPNDANTWVKARAMIENFLLLQWRAGALTGSKSEHAFYVRVGLGQTMTAQDLLDGFLIVEIGMAVVRPAEFVVVRFSHKMQES